MSNAAVKIQRSEFIATLYPVEDASQVKEILSEHNDKFRDATHNCYAYIIGKKQEKQYYSDQGEPSGTAGKPILNALLQHELTNVLAVVTRYFGGIKLGVRGLIDAYHEATINAINNSNIVEYISTYTLYITIHYNALDSLTHILKSFQVNLKPLDYDAVIRAELVIPEENKTAVQKILDDFEQKGLIKQYIPETEDT